MVREICVQVLEIVRESLGTYFFQNCGGNPEPNNIGNWLVPVFCLQVCHL